MGERPMYQIGEFAGLLGLSIATVRHYGELGIVAPSARSPGGFRLYTDEDLERFRFVKHFKPLGFALEEVVVLMDAIDRASQGSGAEVADVIDAYAKIAEDRWQELQRQVDDARAVAERLRTLRAGIGAKAATTAAAKT